MYNTRIINKVNWSVLTNRVGQINYQCESVRWVKSIGATFNIINKYTSCKQHHCCLKIVWFISLITEVEMLLCIWRLFLQQRWWCFKQMQMSDHTDCCTWLVNVMLWLWLDAASITQNHYRRNKNITKHRAMNPTPTLLDIPIQLGTKPTHHFRLLHWVLTST